MQKFLMSLLLILIPFIAAAEQFEHPMLDLDVPSGIEQGQMYFEAGSKFYTSLYNYPKDDFFALLNYGANTRISARYMAINELEVMTSYIEEHREKMAGLAYTIKEDKIWFDAKIEAEYINYQDFSAQTARQNFFGLLSLQSTPFFDDRFVITFDGAYDGFGGRFGMGAGISWLVTRHLSLLGEYYPVIMKYQSNSEGSYGFGIKFDTYGHQFMLRLSNSSEIGARDMMLGAPDNNIYAGFDIMRLVAF
ncbi:MAG: DUF5777 family beta-barrel protein [Candidatus Goldiibacteriota bacterium]